MTGHDDGELVALEQLRLPKVLDEDPRKDEIAEILQRSASPIWAKGDARVPHLELRPPLRRILLRARDEKALVRGLEAAERGLASQDRGNRLADNNSGATRGQRVSRLMFITKDGAPRFYRNVETLLRRFAGRLLVVQLSVTAESLGELLFDEGASVRSVMLDHKVLVADALYALVDNAPAD